MTDKTDSKERDALIRAITSMCHDMDNDKIVITRREGEGPALRQLLDAMQRELAPLAANAGREPVAPPPLQHFESPRAKILMRAWQEGWDACRDAEYVGEDAQNDAFNQSSTVNHCVAEDILYTHPSPPEGMVGGWIAEKEPPCKD